MRRSTSASGLLRSSGAVRAAGLPAPKTARRGYVSETKKDSAQVSVDTTIRADQKAFFAETGKLPENQTVPGSGLDAGAMMSPIAGFSLQVWSIDFETDYSQES